MSCNLPSWRVLRTAFLSSRGNRGKRGGVPVGAEKPRPAMAPSPRHNTMRRDAPRRAAHGGAWLGMGRGTKPAPVSLR
ncbi:hypothetical protein Lokhon_00408 [Limimaricola hongkongensis DSM 17492]|uniref:Uncharacterized protein n=1 Tax=Limimaricola hongkongensis DSM 17492 TaxID=1122180 RepID=A0A017HGX0_9RHOB|nr:hypothetical protein Lokhon_00408 [Limimaricola hongkongensis DSM 17492]